MRHRLFVYGGGLLPLVHVRLGVSNRAFDRTNRCRFSPAGLRARTRSSHRAGRGWLQLRQLLTCELKEMNDPLQNILRSFAAGCA